MSPAPGREKHDILGWAGGSSTSPGQGDGVGPWFCLHCYSRQGIPLETPLIPQPGQRMDVAEGPLGGIWSGPGKEKALPQPPLRNLSYAGSRGHCNQVQCKRETKINPINQAVGRGGGHKCTELQEDGTRKPPPWAEGVGRERITSSSLERGDGQGKGS